jgi:hypothetical protein
MSYAELLAEWSALLERRPTFREALGRYAGILTAWSQWPSHRIAPLCWSQWPSHRIAPLCWSVDECRERLGSLAQHDVEASDRRDTP